MKKIKDSKIFFGTLVIIVIFFGLLAVPKIARFVFHPFSARALEDTPGTIRNNDGGGGGGGGNTPGSGAFSIRSLSAISGPVGKEITIFGDGFADTGNIVHFRPAGNCFEGCGEATISNLDGIDGTVIFNIPDTFERFDTSTAGNVSVPVAPGDYSVTVSTSASSSESNDLNFAVTDPNDSTDFNSWDISGYTGPVYICHGETNCIEGFKVPIAGIASSQLITLDGTAVATTTSYAFEDLSSGLHTVSITSPDDWYVGYTLCINSIDCHSDRPIQGDSVTINFTTNSSNPTEASGVVSVPAGSYVDLYWHFSQNFDDFGSAPSDLNSNTGAGTVPTLNNSGSAQANAYTAGDSGSGGAANGLADAAKNALGCAIGQILGPALRSAVSGGVQKITSAIQAKVTGNPATTVPTNGVQDPIAQAIKGHVESTRSDSNTTLAARVSTKGPAWDALAYCLQNAIIKYINQATLQWVNSAFNGNPAFVQNVGQFLTGLGDQAVLSFFNQIKGVNPNSPFQGNVNQSVLQNYGANFAQQGAYTLGNNFSPGGDKAFTSPGGFTAASQGGGGTSDAYGPISSTKSNWGNFYDLTQNPANHPSGQILIETAAVNDIAASVKEQGVINIIAGKGYPGVNAKNPPVSGSTQTAPGRTGLGAGGANIGVNGSPLAKYNGGPISDPRKAQTITPGSTVQETAQTAINQPYLRQALQTRFDQFLTELINLLINTVLSKIFSHK